MLRRAKSVLDAPLPRDWWLAALFWMPSVAQVLLDPITTRPVGLIVATGATAPLAWRRGYPFAGAIAGTASWLIPTDGGYLYLGFVIAVVLYFSVGLYERRWVQTVVAVLWGAAAGAVAVLNSDQEPITVMTVLLVVVAPVVAGRVVAEQHRQTERLSQLTQRLADDQQRTARLAVAEERARIMREFHDVVGHDITAIALQSEAAAASLSVDPERAREPVAAIGRAAHTLQEMRRVLSGMSENPGVEDTHPAPGAGDLPALVDDARAVGGRVSLAVTGDVVLEPTSVGSAVYRIVQESLTNARRHSPGAPVAVRVSWGPDHVDLEVTNAYAGSAPKPGNGLGLTGMLERARLLGGRLHAAPDGAGQFVVSARLPYEPAGEQG